MQYSQQISLSVLHSIVFHMLLSEIPRSISKTANNFFHYGFHLRPKKKATHTAEMMSVLSVAVFWVVNASSGEEGCLHFSIPTGSGAGGEGGVSQCITLWSAREMASWNVFHIQKNRPWSELSENQPACKEHRDLSNCKVKIDWSIQNPR